MTYLLDSTVLIDALGNRNARPQLLAALSEQDILFACCSINVTEIYMGMRVGEEASTEKFLRSLDFYPVSWEAAQLAGDLYRRWKQKGHSLGLADVTIAAVAIVHGLVLVTDNRKHFPMPEVEILELPLLPNPSGRKRSGK